MKILAVDDHALIREGLRAVLAGADPDLAFVEAGDAASMFSALAREPEIELVLLDWRLPDASGAALLAETLRRFPSLPVVVMSAEADPETIRQAMEGGASGFVPKTSVARVLVSALRLVLSGGVYVPPEVLRAQAAGAAPAVEAAAPAAHPAESEAARQLGLTGRQTEVLAGLLEGKSNKQICRELDLAEATVKVHVRAILRALAVSSRSEAIVAAARLGLRAGGEALSRD